jgi:hypothetical protein
LLPYIAAIDSLQMTCQLSAYIGGYGIQSDVAEVKAVFRDSAAGVLSTLTIGPVDTAATELVLQQVASVVPSLARSVDIVITMTRNDGSYCNAYVDNVSLILEPSVKSLCAGDGSAGACPCGNTGDPGHGCAQSFGILGGGLLTVSGTPSVGSDSVCLHASSLVNGTAGLFFQGSLPVNGGSGRAFGDGLRCVGGSITRLGVRFASGGTMNFGPCVGGDPQVSSVEPTAAGQTRYYQLWYRDSGVYCTSDTFNLTNAVSIAWRL